MGSWALSATWWHLIMYLETWSVAVGIFMIVVAYLCMEKGRKLLNKLK